MNSEKYKELSVKEFTKAAEIYDSGHAGICANSFHHYPNPQKFFDGVARVLAPGGKFILRDYTSSGFVVWLMNHVEMPIANLIGHGDVRCYTVEQVRKFCENAGLTVERIEKQEKFRLHLVAGK